MLASSPVTPEIVHLRLQGILYRCIPKQVVGRKVIPRAGIANINSGATRREGNRGSV